MGLKNGRSVVTEGATNVVEGIVEVVQMGWDHVIVVLVQYKELEKVADETEMLHAYYPNN